MRSTEKQSCGSFTNLNVGDVWGPHYGLPPTLGSAGLASGPPGTTSVSITSLLGAAPEGEGR